MKKLLTLFALLLLLTACTAQEAVPTALPSDGLLHEPYGWENLYGSKEVPEKWWQRTPRDPIAGEKTEIAVAVGKQLDGLELWLEWAKNGQGMEPIACSKRANLQTDGVERTQYLACLPAMERGDEVQYAICAGENGIAQKRLGPFSFRVSAWERFQPERVLLSDEKLTISGTAGGKNAALNAEFDGGALRLLVSDAATGGGDAFPATLSADHLTFTVAENGGFSLRKDGAALIGGAGFELLTDGAAVRAVRFTLDAEESDRFYGFGMKYDALDQRGKAVDTYCVNWYKEQRGETYTPVPYYFVPDKYGLFVDSTYYSRFDLCAQSDTVCVIEARLGGTEEFALPLHFFTGDNAQIAASYAETAGHAVLPPVWAFSPWISANEWNRQSEILEQLDATLETQIPTGVIVIEAWSDEQTFYTFNDSEFETVSGEDALRYEDFTFTGRWPDPRGMVQQLHENGIRCILWQIPVLKYDVLASAQSVRDQIYAAGQGYVLQTESGGTYRLPAGTWFGNSLLLDFTDREATDWFLEKRRYLIEDIGIDGFKTDGGEFVWGRSVTASDGRRGDELRNAYPDLYAQAYYDFGTALTGDFVTFSRAGGSGMQKHPLCWVGDQNSDFKAFQAAIRATLSASQSGIPFVAWDIAGFSGDVPSAELYQRSVAQAAFSAVMQVHSENSGDPQPPQARTPWNMAQRKGDDACLETYRYYANLRMNLIPYIYTEAKWASESGEPLMRSMAYAFPQDSTAADYEFQYLFGRNLLVAPVTRPNAKRVEVYLPDGVWYDFFTGARYEGGVYQIPVAADEIPVFVRAGTLLPVNTAHMGRLASYVGNDAETYVNLNYLVFPGNGEYTWYDYVNQTSVEVKFDGTTLTENGTPADNWTLRGETP